MSSQNLAQVTMIDDLPNLEDLEGNPEYPPRGPTDQQLQKVIRPRHMPLEGSGMYPRAESSYQMQPQQNGPMPQHGVLVDPQFSHINCLEIAHHVNGCPICSRFYNPDKTLYVIAVVLLSVICLLLVKRVLET